jgi:hypothetical protein
VNCFEFEDAVSLRAGVACRRGATAARLGEKAFRVTRRLGDRAELTLAANVGEAVAVADPLLSGIELYSTFEACERSSLEKSLPPWAVTWQLREPLAARVEPRPDEDQTP